MADFASGVKNDRFGALIGLAPKSSETNLPAFMSQIKGDTENGKELDPLFSIYLSRADGDDGVITFGGYDVKEYGKEGLGDKDVFWGKANQFEKYWTIPMDNVALVTRGEDKVMASSEELPWHNRQMILDTGVSYTLVPLEDFQFLVNLLNRFGVQCKEMDSENQGSLVTTRKCNVDDYNRLPDLRMKVKGADGKEHKDLMIPKEAYL